MVDRRYGAGNLYGNGRLYGASDYPIVDDRFQWSVDVDWTGTGYSGSNESIYMTSFESFRGRRSFMKPNGQGFSPVETGTARIILDNSSGRYDGWNTSSALYPYVKAGKKIRVRIRDLDSGTIYPVFTGVTIDIETIGYGADAKVVLKCEDGWYFLRNIIVLFSYAQYQVAGSSYSTGTFSNIQLEDVINNILGGVHWVSGTSIEEATDHIPHWWTSNNVIAGDMLHDVASSFMGYFFIDADGVATYYDRTSARTSVQTYTQSQVLKDIGNSQPWVNQRNVFTIRMKQRITLANQIMWTLSDPIPFGVGETVTFIAKLTYNGFTTPGVSVIANPIVDWLANTLADGTGTTFTTFVTAIQTSYGDAVLVTATNLYTSAGYLWSFQFVGLPIYDQGATDVSYPTIRGMSGAISPTVGDREFVIDSKWHQYYSQAKDIVDTYGPQLTAVRQFPIITFDTRVESLVPDLFDVVNVSIAKLGVSATDFCVGGIEIKTTNETCQGFTVKMYLEPKFTD